MGIADVIEQQHGGALASVADSADASNTKPEGAQYGPSVTFTVGETEHVLTTQTLILYGVIAADLLLLYIALRV